MEITTHGGNAGGEDGVDDAGGADDLWKEREDRMSVPHPHSSRLASAHTKEDFYTYDNADGAERTTKTQRTTRQFKSWEAKHERGLTILT